MKPARPHSTAGQGRAGLFLAEEGGATALEYALLGAVIAAIVVGGLTALAQATGNLFQGVAAAIQAAAGG